MTNFLLIPGAWMGAWVWEPVTRGLRALGHHVEEVTLSGLSEDTDISEVGLATHVADVSSILEAGGLRDVVVVGHLYAGLVAGIVADRAPDRVVHTVFVEAFLPHDGKSMLDAFDEHQREDELRQIAAHQGRWPMVSAPDELVALLAEVAASMSTKGVDAGKMMTLPQGDLQLLESAVAKRLLTSTVPARLAYMWTDDTPRVVPLWFHWTGDELVMATFAPSPKIGALRANPNVALTIDTEGFPPDALLIRGQASVSEVAGAVPEYALAARRYLGEEDATAYLLQVDQPGTTMARIAVHPTWVGVLDFQTRFPRALPQRFRS